LGEQESLEIPDPETDEGNADPEEPEIQDIDIIVEPSELLETLETLRETYEFSLGVTAIHYPPEIHVVYNLMSLEHPFTARIKTVVPDDNPHVPSSIHLFMGNTWHERETYDLFGVVFDGHENLTRIMLPDDWEGHPLRKDAR
jgi:NADH-quinone oxidoreductase subunit C